MPLRPKYEQFCALEADECADIILSFPLLFYGLDHDWSCPLLTATEITSTTTTMIDALETDIGMLQYGFFFDKNVQSNGYATKVRSMIQLGAPLEGYESESDKLTEQYRKYEEFIGDWEPDMWDYFGVKNTDMKSAYQSKMKKDGLRVRYWGFDMQNLEFMRVVQTDMFFSMFSIMFVFIWIFVHTGSAFMASMGMLQIVTSLPIGNFIYKVFFGIPYFDTLHTLVIFLVLGVGADDVFVLVDGWKQTAETVLRKSGEDDTSLLHRRLTIAYARTAQAVFNTSFTTAMAFVATAISPIMPISTFGIYAALCIVLNYIMVVTITPTAILVYEVHVSKWYNCCLCFGSCRPKPIEASKEDSVELNRSGAVEVFFDKIYIPMLTGGTGKVAAMILIVACVSYSAFSAVQAFKLEPPTEQEKWFPDNHMFTGVLDDNGNLFIGGVDDQYVKMNFAFGISGVNRDKNPSGEKFNIYIPGENRGTVVFNNNFDLTNPSTQQDIMDACEAIRTHTCNAEACNFGMLARSGGVTCFMDEFDTWLTDKSVDRTSLTSSEFKAELLDFRTNTKPASDPIVGSWEEMIGFIDGEIKFVNIPFTSTMLTLRPVDKKQEVRKNVDKLIDSINDSAAPTTGKVIDEAGIEWTWMVTEQGLVDGLFIGFAICFPVAFAVLIVATTNIVVSFYAIVSIMMIVSSVMGVVQMVGYALGVAESIAGIIVIGFSVDYVVHLAHMYMEGYEHGKNNRVDRFIYSCTNMGSTVVAGAVTTGGSGSFMFLCQLMFFYKMALLIFMTIFFSLLYALFFFMPMLMLAGPDTDFGNVPTSLASMNPNNKGETPKKFETRVQDAK